MDWMPVRTDLFEDHRLLAMTDLLGAGNLPNCGALTTDDICTKVLRVWRWGRDRTATGKIEGASGRTVDLIIRVDGFAKAMEAVGWLEIGETYLRFPQWDKWNSKGAKARLQNARRQAQIRSRESNAPVARAARQKRDNSVTYRRAEQSRAEQRTAESREEQDIAASAAIPEGVQTQLCSLLRRLVERIGGKDYPIFDDRACAAIAADARCSEMRITWAVERLKATRNPPKKKAAWLRAMILEDDKAPPRGWVEQYQRAQLAKLAERQAPPVAQAMAGGGA